MIFSEDLKPEGRCVATTNREKAVGTTQQKARVKANITASERRK